MMMLFVGLLQPFENPDRILDARRIDHHRLEPALQRRVLLDSLAVLVERGGADALQFAARQRRFDDVGGIHRAFRAARADDGVQLVDEQNHLAGVAHLVDHRLDPLLELAAVFGPRHHQRQVDRINHLVGQQVGHLARDDRLGQPFQNGGLADPRLADQHRIVLRAAAEHLNHPFDLILAADHRVELPAGGEVGQVAPEGVQGGQFRAVSGRCAAGSVPLRRQRILRRLLAFGQVVRIERLDDRLAHLFRIDVEILKDARRLALPFTQNRQQQVFGADEVVVHRRRLPRRQHQHPLEPGRERQCARGLGLTADAAALLHLDSKLLEIEPERFEHVHRDTFVECENAQQKMFGADIVVIEPFRLLFGKQQNLPRPGRQVAEIVFFLICHDCTSSSIPVIYSAKPRCQS